MVQIREINTADKKNLKEIRNLLKELQETAECEHELDNIEMENIFEEMDASPNFYLNYIAVDEDKEGKVVGFISIIFYKTLFHKGGTALINELIVSKDYRGKGVGRKLVEQAVQIARQRGMDEIEVGTEEENIKARNFYVKNGFDKEYILLGKIF